ncbi:SMI1/KNR4 family protein [Nocardia sp. NPDC050175]|uniref:SMI1/KNR4 family protein n=1 Tax=Nocardia sp. NPDC050175 TaxID=3364317 RepID=UPI0037A20A1C
MVTFDEVVASFWDDSGYGVLGSLTDEAIRAAEEQLGVALPGSLVRLLRVQNGGAVAKRWNALPVSAPTLGFDPYVPLDEVMGIGRADGRTTVLDTPYLVEEWGLPAPIVLLDGDGHYWVGLDYRVGGPQGEPSVALFDADRETSVVLAPDFETFLQGLTSAEAFE